MKKDYRRVIGLLAIAGLTLYLSVSAWGWGKVAFLRRFEASTAILREADTNQEYSLTGFVGHYSDKTGDAADTGVIMAHDGRAGRPGGAGVATAWYQPAPGLNSADTIDSVFYVDNTHLVISSRGYMFRRTASGAVLPDRNPDATKKVYELDINVQPTHLTFSGAFGGATGSKPLRWTGAGVLKYQSGEGKPVSMQVGGTNN